jgi:hypothetical protein
MGITPTDAGSGHASEVISAAVVGGDPTVVMEVPLVTCQQIKCKLGGTSVEQLQ